MTSATVSCPICHPLKSSAVELRHITRSRRPLPRSVPSAIHTAPPKRHLDRRSSDARRKIDGSPARSRDPVTVKPKATGCKNTAYDPLGNITTYAYDASGTLVTVTNALGQTTQVTSHDASGRPLTMVDPDNVTRMLTYDLRGRLTSVTIAGATTTIAYDAAGDVIQVTRPDGSFLAYSYDAAHRLIQVSDALGDQIVYTLDALGDRTQTQIHGPGGATLTKTQSAVFDELGRLLQSIGAAGQTTQFSYDNDSNVLSITDPLGNATGQSFDALNRLIQTTAPLASTIAYGYDTHDNPATVADPRGLTTT